MEYYQVHFRASNTEEWHIYTWISANGITYDLVSYRQGVNVYNDIMSLTKQSLARLVRVEVLTSNQAPLPN